MARGWLRVGAWEGNAQPHGIACLMLALPSGWQGTGGCWLAWGPPLQTLGEPGTVRIVQNGLIFQYFPSLLNSLSAWGVKPAGRMLRATAGTACPPALSFP